MRLDRFVSQCTALTRSQAVKAIREGRISVNGMIVKKPDQQVEEQGAEVQLDGNICRYQQYCYYILNKPSGILTASRDRNQKTVLDLFPSEIRKRGIFPVGRLDKDTSGLLLLTNDGPFAHRILSPKSGIKKRYYATVEGRLLEEDVQKFRAGLVLRDGSVCLPADLEILGPGEAFVTVQEGKYHQVRRMLAAVECPVLSLRRLSIGNLQLDEGQEEGEWREIFEKDLCILFNSDFMEK